MDFKIRTATLSDATASNTAILAGLMAQLRDAPVDLKIDWLEQVISFPNTWLILAETQEHGIIGMLSLSAFPRMSGWTPWIEGVVVDAAFRGRGVGKALLQHAIEIAKAEGFEIINLSSRPHREAANALYESLGFELIPTNYRRLRIPR